MVIGSISVGGGELQRVIMENVYFLRVLTFGNEIYTLYFKIM